MAADEELFNAAPSLSFAATLRIYSWRPEALSLGRRQRMEEVDLAACRARGLDVVKRIGGGAAVYHGDDISYCFACRLDMMPLPSPLQWRAVFETMLLGLGIAAGTEKTSPPHRHNSTICFASAAEDEPSLHGKKWVGNARRKSKSVFLQHGSILLLPQPDFLPELVKDAPPHSSEGLLAVAPALTENAIRRAFAGAVAETFHLRFAPATLRRLKHEKTGR